MFSRPVKVTVAVVCAVLCAQCTTTPVRPSYCIPGIGTVTYDRASNSSPTLTIYNGANNPVAVCTGSEDASDGADVTCTYVPGHYPTEVFTAFTLDDLTNPTEADIAEILGSRPAGLSVPTLENTCTTDAAAAADGTDDATNDTTSSDDAESDAVTVMDSGTDAPGADATATDAGVDAAILSDIARTDAGVDAMGDTTVDTATP